MAGSEQFFFEDPTVDRNVVPTLAVPAAAATAVEPEPQCGYSTQPHTYAD